VDGYLLGFVVFLSQDFSSCFVSQSLDVSFSTLKVVCCELCNNGPDSTSVDEAGYKLFFILKKVKKKENKNRREKESGLIPSHEMGCFHP